MLKLYLLLLGSVFGVAAQLQLKQLCSMTAVAVCLLLIALLWLSGASLVRIRVTNSAAIVKILRSLSYNSLLYLSIGVMLGFAWTNYRATLVMQQVLATNLENKALLVDGFIVDLPRKDANGWHFQLQVNQAYQLQPASINAAQAKAAAEIELQPVTVPARISLHWYGRYRAFQPAALASSKPAAVTKARQLPQLMVGQRWLLPVRLKRPHANFNPGGFDYELYAWRHALLAVGAVTTKVQSKTAASSTELALLSTDSVPVKISASHAKHALLLEQQPWLDPINKLRQLISRRIEQRLGSEPRSAAMVAALVVGAQAGFSQADWQVFRATGVIHLISISGLHISMFALIAIWLVRWCWRQLPWLCERVPAQQVGLVLGALLALGYALLTGFGVPAQRTSLMLLCLVILQLSGLRWPIRLVLLLVMVLVLAFDPWALLQPGFWLSFIATALLFSFNLVTAASSDDARLLARQRPAVQLTFAVKLSRNVYQLVRQQWLISLALLPLTILFFQTVSWSSLIANLVAIPLVSVLVTPLALLGLIWPWLWQLNSWLINGLYYWLDWLASFPFALSLVAAAPWYITVLAIIGGGLAVLPLAPAWRWLGVVAIALVFVWPPARPEQAEFKLLVFDVGQGSAAAVLTRQHLLLYDAGPVYSADLSAAQRVLLPFFTNLGIWPDYLLISQAKLNHLGGAYSLLQQRPQLHWSGAVAANHPLQQVRRADKLCLAGDKWHWDGVDFEVLYPTEQDYVEQKKTRQPLSCVLRISNQHQAILLLGDLAAQVPAQLTQRYSKMPDKLRANGFLAPHRASSSSATVALLQAMQAKWAVAQLGYLNRFNQPLAQMAQYYARHSIVFYNSIDCGMLSWYSGQPQQLSCWRQEKGRYWNLLSKNLR